MRITLKKLTIHNFKGCRDLSIDFTDKTEISGANATGKTTVFDALTWLLFGKDSSGSEKFEIRPLDYMGEKVHNIEIFVEGVFAIEYGGESWEKVLKKSQKEKWVKKRGSGVAELQGNENVYEVDGYPRTEKEYKGQIASWVDENVFKMITNPQYFPNMPWKEQRDILMLLSTDQTDVEIAQTLGGFEALLDELAKAPSTDDILAKYKKTMTELKKVQAELPVRIDEVSKQKVVIDTVVLEASRDELKKKLDALPDSSLMNIQRGVLTTEISDLEVRIAGAEKTAIDERDRKLSEISNEIEAERKRIFNAKTAQERLTHIRSMIAQEKDNAGFLAKQHEEELARVFDGETKCPYCGQPLPVESVAKLVAEFEGKKAFAVKRIESDIYTSDANLCDLQQKEKALLELASESTDDAKVIALQESYESLKASPLIIDTAELEAERREKEARNKELAEALYKIAEEKEAINRELKSIDESLAEAKINDEIDKRIAELQEEQREVAQKVMDSEKMVWLVEQFIKEKMDMISGQINSKFDGVNWKLFEKQINGGIKETCEVTINGVPYASANNGARIVAGLQIIKALQKLHERYAPIFIDNAEAVSKGNFPQMDSQIVFLKVTDDKQLKVGEA